MKLSILQVILLIGLAGCATGSFTSSETPVVSEVASDANAVQKVRTIHANDIVILHVVPGKEFEEDLELTVNLDGEILVPLGGWIKVENLTNEDAQAKVKDVLNKYIVNPEVSLRIKEASARAVVILGQVRKPGTYEFPPSGRMTLLEVVAKAEGFTDIANLSKVKVVRNTAEGGQKTLHVNAEKLLNGDGTDVQLQEGDLITVPETLF